MVRHDLAIIGAGPIGVELAVALKRHGMDYVHIEAGQMGQTMFSWPPQTRWFSSNDRIAIAGVPLQTADQAKCTREEYLAYLRTIALEFDLKINTYERVESIQRRPDGFVIETRALAGTRQYEVNKLVLVTGGTARPRRLNVPGEDLPHVSHCLGDPHKYFRRRVVIVGGKNSAIEAALRIHHVGAEMALSYRQAEFDREAIKYWLYPEITSLIKSGAIKGHLQTVVTRIDPEKVTLSPCDPATLAATDGQGSIEVAADFVLLLIGYQADMSLAKMAGVDLVGDREVPVFDVQTMQTNVPGVFIAGTATGGTQTDFRVFVENCHIHVDRILAALTGQSPPRQVLTPALEMPEA